MDMTRYMHWPIVGAALIGAVVVLALLFAAPAQADEAQGQAVPSPQTTSAEIQGH